MENFDWLNSTTPASDAGGTPGKLASVTHLVPNGVESGQNLRCNNLAGEVAMPSIPPGGAFIRQHTPEWFAARKGKITASIAAACLGLNPYESAAKAWRIIKGTEPDHDNYHMRRGRDKEAAARRLYEARHGVQVAEAGFVVHPQLPWLGASPDGLVGPMGVLELKCPKALPEDVPVYHTVQCVIQMACTGRWFTDYLAYVGPGQIFERRIIRDLPMEACLLMKLAWFWQEYVVKGVQPPKKFKLSNVPAHRLPAEEMA